MKQYRDGCMNDNEYQDSNAYEVNLSSAAKRMQLDISESKSKKRTIANKKMEIRKNFVTEFDAVLNDPDANEEYQEDCMEIMQIYYGKLLVKEK